MCENRTAKEVTTQAAAEQNDSGAIGADDSIAVEVRIPGLLRDCTEGKGRLTVHATTLDQAVEALLVAYPRLRVHLYDEQGELRRHILLFYNQTNFKVLDHTHIPLRAGDRLNVVQAVSGGA